MSVVSLVINSEFDFAKKGRTILPEIKPEDVTELHKVTIGILENGTDAGQMAISFCLEDTNKKVWMAQITQNQFMMLMGAFLGAKSRFGYDKPLLEDKYRITQSAEGFMRLVHEDRQDENIVFIKRGFPDDTWYTFTEDAYETQPNLGMKLRVITTQEIKDEFGITLY